MQIMVDVKYIIVSILMVVSVTRGSRFIARKSGGGSGKMRSKYIQIRKISDGTQNYCE